MEPIVVNCERVYNLIKHYYAVDELGKDRILLTAQITHNIQQMEQLKKNTRVNVQKKNVN